MPEASVTSRASPSPSSAGALVAGWRRGASIVNLRGDPADATFRDRAGNAIGVELPRACRSNVSGATRVVWAGPDDFFVIGAPGGAAAVETRLREALAGTHHAVTDVSGGYAVLRLAGPPVLDVLAHGCPLDLHPRVFGPGACAGSHFFKASVWLWKTGDAPEFELLVRRSFIGYAWLMLERCTAECGLATIPPA